MGGALQRLDPHCNRPRSVAPEPPPLRIRCGWGYRRKEPERGPTMASEICMVLSAMLPWAASTPAEAQAALAAARASGRSIKINGGGFSPKNEIRSARAKFPLVLFFSGDSPGVFSWSSCCSKFCAAWAWQPNMHTCSHTYRQAILTAIHAAVLACNHTCNHTCNLLAAICKLLPYALHHTAHEMYGAAMGCDQYGCK